MCFVLHLVQPRLTIILKQEKIIQDIQEIAIEKKHLMYMSINVQYADGAKTKIY